MQTCKLTFDAKAGSLDLILTARLDDQIIFKGSLAQDFQNISYEFNDDDGDHLLELEMSGKTIDHTIIDSQQIISDHVITIENVSFDKIPLGYVFTKLSEYHHDFNGTQNSTVEKFYSVMGCNGTVRLKFTTPLYLWLLENM